MGTARSLKAARTTEELDAVVEVEPDVIAGPEAAGRERVRQPIGALVELPIRPAAITADGGDPIRDRVHEALEEIGEVVLHMTRSRGGYGRSLPTIHIAKNCDPPP
jgi:hypothetical protein